MANRFKAGDKVICVKKSDYAKLDKIYTVEYPFMDSHIAVYELSAYLLARNFEFADNYDIGL